MVMGNKNKTQGSKTITEAWEEIQVFGQWGNKRSIQCKQQ